MLFDGIFRAPRRRTLVSVVPIGIARTPFSSLEAPASCGWAFVCLVDRDSSIPQKGAVQPLNGGSCVLVVAHLDKAKAFASPRVAISDHPGIDDLSYLSEQIEQIALGGLIGCHPVCCVPGVHILCGTDHTVRAV
jgi:hypothetical protein